MTLSIRQLVFGLGFSLYTLLARDGALSAAPILDQQSLQVDNGYIVGPGLSGQIISQSFTVGVTGALSRVDLQLRRHPTAPTAPLDWMIVGTTIGGMPQDFHTAVPLASGSVAAVNVPSGSPISLGPWVSLDLAQSNVHLNAGGRYAIVVSTTAPYVSGGGNIDPYGWLAGPPSSYGPGSGYSYIRFSSNPPYQWAPLQPDMAFRTWIEPGYPTSQSDIEIIPEGAVWKYQDKGTNPGADWTSLDFDDGAWKVGIAELGYGDGDEATVVNCGLSRPTCQTNNIATTYFRHAFDTTALGIADIELVKSLNVHLLRDDAAAVYLNGTQIFRDPSLPLGAVYTTYATASSPRDDYIASFSVGPALLREGRNVVAVEVHQSSGSSTDVSFNLRMPAIVATVPEPPSVLLLGLAVGCIAVWSFQRKTLIAFRGAPYPRSPQT